MSQGREGELTEQEVAEQRETFAAMYVGWAGHASVVLNGVGGEGRGEGIKQKAVWQ